MAGLALSFCMKQVRATYTQTHQAGCDKNFVYCFSQPARSEGAAPIARSELSTKQRFMLIASCGTILMLYVGGEVAVGL